MKDFMFSITSPILKSLSNNHNVHVLKGLSRRLLPQTGFGTYARGIEIMEAVEDGDFRRALDKMAAHRRKFQVDGLWKLQDTERIGEVYRQCRKTLWHIDTLLTERLKSQPQLKLPFSRRYLVS